MKKILLFIVIIIAGCSNSIGVAEKEAEGFTILPEVEFQEIKLSGFLGEGNSEISGLAWWDEYLILLAQYPSRFSDNEDGAIPLIAKSAIAEYLNGNNTNPLNYELYTLSAPGLENYMSYGSGFEAIDFHGNNVYVTIEKMEDDDTRSYIIKGVINKETKTITLDKKSLTKIPAPENIYNFSNETLFVMDDIICTIYEGNGANINPEPFVYCFDTNLKNLTKLPMPNIEYRITDAAYAGNGNVWLVNYNYPGEKDKVNPAADSIAIKYGIGKTNFSSEVMERLICLKLDKKKAQVTDEKPVYIKLAGESGRNWEGLVKYDETSFLIATDMFPQTILGYIKKDN